MFPIPGPIPGPMVPIAYRPCPTPFPLCSPGNRAIGCLTSAAGCQRGCHSATTAGCGGLPHEE